MPLLLTAATPTLELNLVCCWLLPSVGSRTSADRQPWLQPLAAAGLTPVFLFKTALLLSPLHHLDSCHPMSFLFFSFFLFLTLSIQHHTPQSHDRVCRTAG